MKVFNFFGVFFFFVFIILLEFFVFLNKFRILLIFMIFFNVIVLCIIIGLLCSLSLENLCFKRERVGFRDFLSVVLIFGCFLERFFSFFNVDVGLIMYFMLVFMEFFCRYIFCRFRFNRFV